MADEIETRYEEGAGPLFTAVTEGTEGEGDDAEPYYVIQPMRDSTGAIIPNSLNYFNDHGACDAFVAQLAALDIEASVYAIRQGGLFRQGA